MGMTTLDESYADEDERSASLWRDAWHRLAKNKMAVACGIILGLITIVSFLGPLFLSQTYYTQDLSLGAIPPGALIGWELTR